jgi:PEP-CTERM motif
MGSKLIVSTAAVALVIASYSASAAPLIYDGFDYTAGTPLDTQNGGTGFANAWQAAQPDYAIASGSLSFGNLQTSGNHVQFTEDNLAVAEMQRPIFNPGFGAAGTTMWASMLIRPDADVTNTLIWAQFGDLYFGRARFDAPLNYQVWEPDTSTLQFSSVPIVTGQTAFIAIRFDFNADPLANDTVTFYFDPTPGVTPSSGGIVVSDINIDASGFAAFGANGAAYSFDELRIGETFQDVSPLAGVPEPSTWAMMLIGFASLGFAGYKRMRKTIIAA